MTDHDRIGLAAEMACLLEASAEKPGNVNRRHDFNDTRFEDFMISAVALGAAFRSTAGDPVGTIILEAVRATRRLVGVNTNLGIVIALAPLAKAAGLEGFDKLRPAVRSVLKNLTVQDAKSTYQAIRLASPAGMGSVEQNDVRDEAVNITLRQAMEQARAWDALAGEYADDFRITFDLGLPALQEALIECPGVSEAVVQTFLSILAQTPDTLIARKKGRPVAEEVSARAGEILKLGGVLDPRGIEEMEKFDLMLRDEKHTLNPGTTADLVAAVLFVYLVENDLQLPIQRPRRETK